MNLREFIISLERKDKKYIPRKLADFDRFAGAVFYVKGDIPLEDMLKAAKIAFARHGGIPVVNEKVVAKESKSKKSGSKKSKKK